MWPRTVALTLTLLVCSAGHAAAASWTALVSQEAHLTGNPPSGASLAAIDLGAAPPTGSSPVGVPNPFEVAISPDATTAYVASFGDCASNSANLVQPVDLTVSPPAAKLPIPLGDVGAFGLVASPDGRTLFASGCGKVVPIDVSGPAPVVGSSIAVGADPFALA
ncbi:MAG: hypothetical protein QOF76_1470, partial [Solirubrobacteraceae bacterium]|nr:hypothetical protein [Solirubrobacteraceae bacterium]